MIMSFVGAVGTLMKGSELEEILKFSFVRVLKLLSGKKFPQNVRALRIVTEEVLRPVLHNQGLHTTSDLTKYLDLKSQQSNTTKLCLIKPVLIMMKFARAEREEISYSICMLLKICCHNIMFASGHVNYAQYGLYYL